MKTPLVSIVVICWNNKRYLNGCLSSVLSLAYPNIEVLLTDNASSDGSADYVRQNFPSITVIQNEKNLGFAEGNNVAIRQAKGKYVVTLNPDTKVDERWIEELVKVAEKDDHIGSCASKVLFLNNPARIDSVGELILRTGDAMGKGFYSIDRGQYDEEEGIFGVTAGAGFYRKKTLDEIGLFDKGLFTWYEDVDLMWRMRLTGWKCIYVPSAIVYHHHSGTVDDLNPMKIYYLHRNRIYVVLKNYPLRLLVYYSKIIAKSEFLFFKQCIREKNIAGVKGQISAIFNSPKILIIRMKLRSKRKISVEECIEWIEKSEKHFLESKGIENIQKYFEDLSIRREYAVMSNTIDNKKRDLTFDLDMKEYKELSKKVWKEHDFAYLRLIHFIDAIKHIGFSNLRYILDAGGGFGNCSFYLSQKYSNIPIDLLDIDKNVLSRAIKFAKDHNIRNINFIEQDLQKLNSIHKYDFILTIEVLEHIENDGKVLTNLYNALKPGGYLYIEVPQHHGKMIEEERDLRAYERETFGHIRIGYNPVELRKRLNKLGFSIVLSGNCFFIDIGARIREIIDLLIPINKELDDELQHHFEKLYNLDLYGNILYKPHEKEGNRNVALAVKILAQKPP